jgi:hypothetical protein
MHKALQNICREFSDSYVCEKTNFYFIISAKINVDDLADFALVLNPFGFELQEIQASSAFDVDCVAIFTKPNPTILENNPSGAFFGNGNFDFGPN